MTNDRMRHWAPLLDALAEEVAARGAEGWFVGGCLRNALLGLDVADVDVALTVPPLEIARTLRQRFALGMTSLARDTYRLVMRERGERGPTLQLDLSALYGATIADDLAQRDFRVNAFALPLVAHRQLLDLSTRQSRADDMPPAPPPDLLDPLGGLADLRARVLNPASEEALSYDSGRILRAARLIAAQGFRPADATRDQAREASRLLPYLVPDRLREELSWLLALPRCAGGLAFLAEVGALAALFPALAASAVSAHALASIAATADLQSTASALPLAAPDSLAALLSLPPLRARYAAAQPDGHLRVVALRLGLLVHATVLHREDPSTWYDDDGSYQARQTLKRLGISHRAGSLAQYILDTWGIRQALVGGGKQRALPEEMRARKLFAHSVDRYGEVRAVEGLVAAVACNAAMRVAPLGAMSYSAEECARARAWLSDFFATPERLVPAEILTGADLIEHLGLTPGPLIGRLLFRLRGAQVGGFVQTREEALDFVRRR